MANERNLNQAQNQPENRLLTHDERELCKIVAQGNDPHDRRALALLALDQGVTLADASELSGLTTGQVRYWRDKFRQQRLSIFPEDPLGDDEPIDSDAAPEEIPEQTAQPGSQSSKTKRADKDKKKADKEKKPSKMKTGDKKAKPKGEKTKKGKKAKSKKEKKKGSKAKTQKPTKKSTSSKKSEPKSKKKKKLKSEKTKTKKSEAKEKTSKSSRKNKQ